MRCLIKKKKKILLVVLATRVHQRRTSARLPILNSVDRCSGPITASVSSSVFRCIVSATLYFPWLSSTLAGYSCWRVSTDALALSPFSKALAPADASSLPLRTSRACRNYLQWQTEVWRKHPGAIPWVMLLVGHTLNRRPLFFFGS
jgi:hypothetical protein